MNLFLLQIIIGIFPELISDRDIRDVTSKAGLYRLELEQLFVELGLGLDEIEKAKRSANTQDFQLEAASVLRYWRIINGKAATKQAVLDALKGCQSNLAWETLQEMWLKQKPKGTLKTIGMFLLCLWG